MRQDVFNDICVVGTCGAKSTARDDRCDRHTRLCGRPTLAGGTCQQRRIWGEATCTKHRHGN